MITLHHQITIEAPSEKVWDTMISAETYNSWARAFSNHSMFVGEWGIGETIDFVDPTLGGSRAQIIKWNPYHEILIRHIGLLDQDMHMDINSEAAIKWIDSSEHYYFSQTHSSTELRIETTTDREFAEMLDTSWPKALALLKGICE